MTKYGYLEKTKLKRDNSMTEKMLTINAFKENNYIVWPQWVLVNENKNKMKC